VVIEKFKNPYAPQIYSLNLETFTLALSGSYPFNSRIALGITTPKTWIKLYMLPFDVKEKVCERHN